jgi:hypothetical protein
LIIGKFIERGIKVIGDRNFAFEDAEAIACFAEGWRCI